MNLIGKSAFPLRFVIACELFSRCYLFAASMDADLYFTLVPHTLFIAFFLLMFWRGGFPPGFTSGILTVLFVPVALYASCRFVDRFADCNKRYLLALLIVGTASSLVFVIFGVLGIDHSNEPDTLTAVFRAIAAGFGFAAAVTLMSRLSEKYERPYMP